jgi:hypothetical protein
MVCTDGIPVIPWNRKQTEFRSGIKIEANFRNFVPKHFAEENTLSILFDGPGNFRFESLFQNTATENSKNSVRKDDFWDTDKKILFSYFGYSEKLFRNEIPFPTLATEDELCWGRCWKEYVPRFLQRWLY